MFELMGKQSDVEFTIKASYLEVYNEKVQVDLKQTNLKRIPLSIRAISAKFICKKNCL